MQAKQGISKSCKQKLSFTIVAYKSYRSFDAILRFFLFYWVGGQRGVDGNLENINNSASAEPWSELSNDYKIIAAGVHVCE